MYKLSRRNFIALSGLFAFPDLSKYFNFFSSQSKKFITAAHLVTSHEKPSYAVIKFDLSTSELAILPVAFEGHGIYGQNDNSQICLVTGKRGNKKSALINTKSMSVLNEIESQKDYSFYGHSCQDSKGLWYIVEENQKENKSIVSVWTKNLDSLVKVINIDGSGAHDINYLKETDEILVGVANDYTNKESELQRINTLNGQIVHRIKTFDNDALVDHFKIFNNKIYVGVRNRNLSEGTQALLGHCRLNDEKIKPIILPKKIVSDLPPSALSVEVTNASKSISITTTGDSSKNGHVLSWSLDSLKFDGYIRSKETLGLGHIDKTTYITTGNKGLISFVSENQVKKTINIYNKVSVFGAHLLIV